MNLTDASLKLFDALAEDGPNWSGQPLISISKEQRGNLTQLKRAGLITTTEDDGNSFAIFTEAGKKLAGERGHKDLLEELAFHSSTEVAS